MKPHASRFAAVLVLGLAACGAEPPFAEPEAAVVERSIPPTPGDEVLDPGNGAADKGDAIALQDGGDAAVTEEPVPDDGPHQRDAREAAEEAALRIFDAARRLREAGRDAIQMVGESMLDGEASEIETRVE